MKPLTPFQLTVLESQLMHCRGLHSRRLWHEAVLVSFDELEELLRVYRLHQPTVITVTEGTVSHEYLTLPMPSKNDCTCQPTLVHQESCQLYLPYGDASRCFTCKKARTTDQGEELCGHDVDDGHGRRWYCSPECYR